MSFKCDSCRVSQKAGVKPVRVVVEERARIYPVRVDAWGRTIDRGGRGKEIASEANLCGACNEMVRRM